MAETAPDKTYLTAKDAARYLRRSPSTLSDWRVQGIGPRYFKFGPSKKAAVLYLRHDLDVWLAQFAVDTEPAISHLKGKQSIANK